MHEWFVIRELVRGPFRDAACLVPNVTHWGGEIDLLVLKPNLKIIDCEAKISRSDLLADSRKDKWWRQEMWPYGAERPPRQSLEWPRYAWKHYYAMPEAIWSEDLVARIKPMSGILLLRDGGGVRCRRAAKPSPTAKCLSEQQLVVMMRLATLRMWDALGRAATNVRTAA